jgi:hypothetical protein
MTDVAAHRHDVVVAGPVAHGDRLAPATADDRDS